MIKTYAGIGARKTPPDIIAIMKLTAQALASDSYCCNTGAALGADQAFAEGAAKVNRPVQLFLPWTSYEQNWITSLGGPNFFPNIYVANSTINSKAFQSVNEFHPAPHKLSRAVKALHARNWLIINGTQFVICWTPNGETIGGTGQAIRIAESMGIHVYNLGNDNTLQAFIAKLNERTKQ